MRRRPFAQLLAALLTNPWVPGFLRGQIFTGGTKRVCVPTLNCYSCPGALFACPIGAAQVTLSAGGGLDATATHTLWTRLAAIADSTPMFVVGFLTLVGALVGRGTCGWLCPFGALQDLVVKIPVPKFAGPRILSWGRYVVLVVLVIGLPVMALEVNMRAGANGGMPLPARPILKASETGEGEPSFCKYLCPAGTLEGGIPLPLLRSDLRSTLGWLYAWKVSLLAGILLLMLFFKRPFCRWLCPLGAFYGPFNRISIVQLYHSPSHCTNCGLCRRRCPVSIDPTRDTARDDCLRCGDCSSGCPQRCFSFTPGFAAGLGAGENATGARAAEQLPPEHGNPTT